MKREKLRKILFPVAIAILTVAVLFGIVIGLKVKSQMKDLFRMNDDLKAQGYYMGDFEFKMLSFSYYLDKGSYMKALFGINKLHNELISKEGIIKIPQFSSKEEEMEFYISLQNPKTGAFIDDSYPYCTYNEVTENILLHLDALAKETEQPLKLKYPLKYLDEINTPEKLTEFLDDVSHVGWISNRFPQTSYVFARSLLSYCNGEGVIAKNNLYDFSPEFEKTLLQWFYQSQDTETGFWGPKSKNGKRLLRKDLNNTASIIKTFVDENGNDIYPEFPLKYKDRLFQTTLEVLSEPMPTDDELAEWHEWSLKMGKGSAMLVRYLWKDASSIDKDKAKELFKAFIKNSFEKHYIANEGAFSYNPNSQNATIDGTGSKISLLTNLGFFSTERQEYLWDNPQKSIVDLGTYQISSFSKDDFDIIANYKEVNSIRLYRSDVDFNDVSDICYVVYPQKPVVLDALDLAQKVKHWIRTTSQTMGNWTSKETVIDNLESVQGETVPVYENYPLEGMNDILRENNIIVAVGYDYLQLPRYKIKFELTKDNKILMGTR